MRRALMSALAVVSAAALAGTVVPRPQAARAAISAPLAWQTTTSGRIHFSSPAIADVNGDGKNEIVVGDLNGLVHVYKGDGSGELPGWPQPARVDGVHATAVESAPAVADLDGDGKKEIVVGATSTLIPNQQGGLVVFSANGRLRWRWQGNDLRTIWNGNRWGADGYTEGVAATPAIGDVNGDGHPDIVFGGFDTKIHALDRSGRELPGFPYQADDAVWSSAALTDVDGDGRVEIFVGSGSSGGGPQPHLGGTMYALKWRSTGVQTLWRKNLAESADGSPAIGDINGDGWPDVVMTTSYYYRNTDSRRVFAWRAADGATVRGYPVDTGSITAGGPAVGDVNGDGRLDVVVGSWDGHARAYTGSGRKLWDVNVFAGYPWPAQRIEGAAVIADLDGDGRQDVAMPSDKGLWLLDGQTGARLTPILSSHYVFQNSPAVAVLGGQLRVVAAGYDPTGATAIGGVQVYTLPSTTATPAWSQFRQNAARVGGPSLHQVLYPPWQCAKNTNPVATPTSGGGSGYRVVYRSGGIKSYGSIPAVSGLGHKPSTPVVAAVDTPAHDGTWIVTRGGTIGALGAAVNHGWVRNPNAPATSIAATPSGNGYWVLLSNGRVFSFGDARFYGNAYRKSSVPLQSIAATPSGHGYWLLASNGAVFAFGDARLYGSAYGKLHNTWAVSLTPTPTGQGYWLQTIGGTVLRFGDAPYRGSVAGYGFCVPRATVALASGANGGGYAALGSDGRVYTFGNVTGRGYYLSATGAASIIVAP